MPRRRRGKFNIIKRTIHKSLGQNRSNASAKTSIPTVREGGIYPRKVDSVDRGNPTDRPKETNLSLKPISQKYRQTKKQEEKSKDKGTLTTPGKQKWPCKTEDIKHDTF